MTWSIAQVAQMSGVTSRTLRHYDQIGLLPELNPATAPLAAFALAGYRKAAKTMEIWIKPECSKCSTALSILDDATAEYTVRRYLDDPPTADEIREVLARLALHPWDITRTGEARAAELGLAGWPRDADSRDRWISTLAENPILLQRPIITVKDGPAVVGRTEQAVRSLLDDQS